MNISKEELERIEAKAKILYPEVLCSEVGEPAWDNNKQYREEWEAGATHEHLYMMEKLAEKDKEISDIKASDGRGWKAVQSLKEEREKDQKSLQWHSDELQSLIKKNDSLKEENERLKNGWISVKERLPEIGDEYNVVWEPDASGSVVTTMEYDAIEKKFIDKAGFCDSDCTEEVTHWQPLPEPPQI